MKHHSHQKLLAHVDPQTIIEKVEPFMLETRIKRIEEVLEKRLESIHLIFESPADIHNAMAGLRSAEAFGIVHLHIIAPDNKAIHAKSISQSSIYWVKLHFYDSLDEFLQQLPNDNRCLAGAKMDGEQELSELPVDQPLYLFLGNENRGLSDEAVAACDTTYQIPMHGMVESLNLSVSASISLYDTTRRLRESLDDSHNLSEATMQSLKAQYYLNSISPKLAPKLFSDHDLKG